MTPEEEVTRANQARDQLEQDAAQLFIGAVLAEQVLSEEDEARLRKLVAQAVNWHIQTLIRLGVLMSWFQDSTVTAEGLYEEAAAQVLDIRSWAATQDRAPGGQPVRQAAATGLATHVFNSAGELVATSAAAEGLTMRKVWVTRMDSRVRPLHRRLHGDSQPLGEDFVTWPDGQKLRFPGDPLAPPSATIGCRCVLVFSTQSASEITGLFPDLPDEENDSDPRSQDV